MISKTESNLVLFFLKPFCMKNFQQLIQRKEGMQISSKEIIFSKTKKEKIFKKSFYWAIE